MDKFKCPQCGTEQWPKYHVELTPGVLRLYYKCEREGCRCHFSVISDPDMEPHVIAQSGQRNRVPKESPVLVGAMGCPECGQYGKVKTTIRRKDGYWRRHQCNQCGPYYTCKDEDGITVHKRLKNLRAIEL